VKKTIYVFSPGQIRRKDNTVFYQGRRGKRFLPVEDVNEIMVMGEVDFNKKFVEFASQKEILVHYFSHYGYYMGTFYPREHLNSGYMILKQAECYMDADKRLEVARGFVRGAIRNIRQVLRYYAGRGKDVQEQLDQVERVLGDVDSRSTTEELMALEGNVRRHYYAAFDSILEAPDFVFERRSRRPPRNNLNTLISFGNSLMYVMVLSEIYHTHLDPRIGFLHTSNFRRFSLNLDVAEVFKPIIIDRLILSLIDRKQITARDFDAASGGIVMKEKGKKTFVNELERKLKTTIRHRKLDREVSYRRLIRMELYKLEKHLMGEERYEPFVARW